METKRTIRVDVSGCSASMGMEIDLNVPSDQVKHLKKYMREATPTILQLMAHAYAYPGFMAKLLEAGIEYLENNPDACLKMNVVGSPPPKTQ